jgi:hypothetical protein
MEFVLVGALSSEVDEGNAFRNDGNDNNANHIENMELMSC